MKDYKYTLNLPTTKFSMKANLVNREPYFLEKWNKLDVYNQLRKIRKNAEKYILHDGPPYANGEIHVGHALNKTLKDIIVKSKNLSGYNTPFVPGWDCHGLPIEIKVEQKYGKVGFKINHKDFRKKCRDYAYAQIEKQKQDFIRLGIIADWQNPYLTMNFKQEANTIRAFIPLVEQDYLIAGFKPTYWCFDCQSSLAEAEVEYANKTSNSIYVKFKFDSNKKLAQIFGLELGNKSVSAVIWTTTPWTLPLNQAVSINPEFTYQLVEIDNEFLVIEQSLVVSCLEKFNLKFKVITSCKGYLFDKLLLNHPFYDKKIPMLLGDHVTNDSGTGLVHTAPDHGKDDFEIGRKYDLKTLNLVKENGVYSENLSIFAGQFVFKAEDKILQMLKNNNNLLYHTKIEHSYPNCWRHKKPIVFLASPQYFIKLDKEGYKPLVNQAINQIDWLPEWGKERMNIMIENRADWCISRQRTWGTPIPLIINKTTGDIHHNMPNIIENVAKKVEEIGIDAWFDLKLEDLIEQEEVNNYKKLDYTADVWFDSGVTHFTVLQKQQEKELTFPADLYLEGSDQYRGWFQSSLLSSLIINKGQAPYKQIVTHGFTVDEKGYKMSKSIGNVILSQNVIKQYGADILRLWVASSNYVNEVSISDGILKRNVDVYRKIRNTIRFLLSNINDFSIDEDYVNYNDLIEFDKWILSKAVKTQNEIKQCYEQFKFVEAINKIHSFCTKELGAIYLDIIKDRQYTLKTKSNARLSSQTVMYHITHALVRWIMPVLSFTAEEVWEFIRPKDSSILLQTWYEADCFKELVSDKFTIESWDNILVVKELFNKEFEKLREKNNYGSSLNVEIKVYLTNELLKEFEKFGKELAFLFISSKASVYKLTQADKSAIEVADGIKILITKLDLTKCERCWLKSETVGYDTEHPVLCKRCITNIFGNGENRLII